MESKEVQKKPVGKAEKKAPAKAVAKPVAKKPVYVKPKPKPLPKPDGKKKYVFRCRRPMNRSEVFSVVIKDGEVICPACTVEEVK